METILIITSLIGIFGLVWWNIQLQYRIDILKLDIESLNNIWEIQDNYTHNVFRDHAETLDSHSAAINRLEELLFKSNQSQEENKAILL